MNAFARGLGALAFALACTGFAAGAGAGDPRQIVLADQNGTPFDIADLKGRPIVVTFVATRCTDACPIANAMFSRLQARLRRDRVRAQLLTITLDPAYDSPFVMGQVAHQFAADAREWRFASGTPERVHRLMQAFGVKAQPDEHGVPDVHTTFVYVLDARGRLAKTLLLSSNLPDEAAQALRDKALFAH